MGRGANYLNFSRSVEHTWSIVLKDMSKVRKVSRNSNNKGIKDGNCEKIKWSRAVFMYKTFLLQTYGMSCGYFGVFLGLLLL